jgi:hypothetical protein
MSGFNYKFFPPLFQSSKQTQTDNQKKKKKKKKHDSRSFIKTQNKLPDPTHSTEKQKQSPDPCTFTDP